MNKYLKVIHEGVKKSGITPAWNQTNPFWRLFVVIGWFSVGWGTRDMLLGNISGAWVSFFGLFCLIQAFSVLEYLYSEKNNDPDTSQDE